MAFYTDIVLTTRKTILSGDDLSFLPSLAAGGKGCVSVLSNICPRAVQSMYNLYCQGKNEEALSYHHRLFPLMQALFLESNPAPVKAILSMKHSAVSNTLRLPLTPVSTANFARLQKIYQEAKKNIRR